MKVCIISPGLPIPATKGGAIEKLVQEIIPHYRQSKVTVFSEDSMEQELVWTDSKGIDYVQFRTTPFRMKLKKFLNRIAGRGIFGLYDFFFIRKVTKRLNFQPDLLHLHNNFYYIPLLRNIFPRSRIILHMHNDFLFERGYLKNEYNKILSKVDGVIGCSRHVINRIVSNAETTSGKSYVVHNGVSLERFRKLPSDDPSLLKWRDKLKFDENDKVLIFVGRIHEIKGVEVLVKAFTRLTEHHSNLKLLIVGTSWFAEWEETDYLKKIWKLSTPLKDKIKFSGFVSHDELSCLYNLSSICVVPSIFNDPCPLVLFEAMASGCAVVASNVGGIPEIIKDQQTGLLTSPDDVDGLYEKINFLLEHEQVRRELIKNGMNYVQNKCDWSLRAQQLESIYFKLMEKEPHGKS